MLQKTAPSIMQVKRSENDMVTGPSLKLVEAIPTVKRTKATATESLFEREWKQTSMKFIMIPISAPNNTVANSSSNGSTTIETMEALPASKAVAIPNDRAKTTSPTASSMATTINNSLVSGPLALYCLTTIKVAAGAVAAAMAPSTMALDKDRISGKIR